jgi:hypothetical protein
MSVIKKIEKKLASLKKLIPKAFRGHVHKRHHHKHRR